MPSSANISDGEILIYNDKEFKRYDDMYYVSADGDIYSTFKHGLLKQAIDIDGYHRVDIHGKHMKVHRLVYETWVGKIPDDKQINHIDDDKDNNTYTNLYLGTQKENIHDCMRNNHRVGNKQQISVYDKALGIVKSFQSVRDFLDTTGHSNISGSLSKCSKRNWFKERYEILSRKGVETTESYIPVTN